MARQYFHCSSTEVTPPSTVALGCDPDRCHSSAKTLERVVACICTPSGNSCGTFQSQYFHVSGGSGSFDRCNTLIFQALRNIFVRFKIYQAENQLKEENT